MADLLMLASGVVLLVIVGREFIRAARDSMRGR